MTDLELARADTRELRAGRDRLKVALQQRLGDQLSHQSLVERVDELTQHNQRVAEEVARLREDNAKLRRDLSSAEEDLAGACTALRRLMHQKNARP